MRSASRPTSITPFAMPRISAGREAVAATRRPRSISPARARRIRRGKDVATPGSPAGASLNGTLFSSSVWGAWSLAMASIRPRRNASHRASRSAGDRSGGFTFPRAPRVLEVSRKRWCGVTSHVAPDGTASRASTQVTWAMWTFASPRLEASHRSALDSAAFGRAAEWSSGPLTFTFVN